MNNKLKAREGTGPGWMTMACGWYFFAIGCLIWKRGFPINHQWGLTIFFLLVFAFVGMIMISGGPYALIKRPELLTWRSMGAALLINAVIFAFYGLIVLTLGITPTRYNQRELPRAASITYFVISAAMGIAGGLCLLFHIRHGKDF